MELQEMKNLAHLARIAMTDAELTSMAHEFEGILGYVAQINKVEIKPLPEYTRVVYLSFKSFSLIFSLLIPSLHLL